MDDFQGGLLDAESEQPDEIRGRRKKDFDLPRGMRRQGPRFYYDMGGKPRKWIPLGKDILVAMRKWDALDREKKKHVPAKKMNHPIRRNLREKFGFGGTPDPIKHMKMLYNKARHSAAARKIPFNLRERDVIYLYHESKGFCSLTGIPFSFDYDQRWSRRPWTPSLDRINHKGGYVFSNMRLVCAAVNICLSDWGDEVFKRIALGFATSQVEKK